MQKILKSLAAIIHKNKCNMAGNREKVVQTKDAHFNNIGSCRYLLKNVMLLLYSIQCEWNF